MPLHTPINSMQLLESSNSGNTSICNRRFCCGCVTKSNKRSVQSVARSLMQLEPPSVLYTSTSIRPVVILRGVGRGSLSTRRCQTTRFDFTFFLCIFVSASVFFEVMVPALSYRGPRINVTPFFFFISFALSFFFLSFFSQRTFEVKS